MPVSFTQIPPIVKSASRSRADSEAIRQRNTGASTGPRTGCHGLAIPEYGLFGTKTDLRNNGRLIFILSSLLAAVIRHVLNSPCGMGIDEIESLAYNSGFCASMKRVMTCQ